MPALKWRNEKVDKTAAAPHIAYMILAIACAGLLWLPRFAIADIDYDGADSSTSDRPYVDGGDWFNAQNWDVAAAVPVVNGLPDSNDIASISAATGFVGATDPNITIGGNPIVDSITDSGGNAVQGAIFDPVGFGDASSTAAVRNLYVGSSPGKIGSVVQPNVLTIKSGTLEVDGSADTVAVGRDTDGEIIQTGGNFNESGDLAIGGHTTQTSESGSVGIYDYRGGVLQAGVDYGTSDPGIRLGKSADDVGILEIHNSDAVGNQILLGNYYSSYQQGALGILQYYFENGGVTTINISTEGPTYGEVQLRNWGTGTPTFGTGIDGAGGGIGSVLNLTLNSAPTLIGGKPQNLALITYLERTHDVSDPNKDDDFFTTDGTDLTQGSDYSAVFGNTLYTWQISYTGSVRTADANIPSNDIRGTGGNNQTGGAIVLIGVSAVPIPEPASLALFGGVASLLLVRRRNKKGR